MKYSWKGHIDRNSHKNRIKRSGQAWLVYVFDQTWEKLFTKKKQNQKKKKKERMNRKGRKKANTDYLLKLTQVPLIGDRWLVVSWILIGQILGLRDILIGCARGRPQLPEITGYTSHPLHQYQPPWLYHNSDRCQLICKRKSHCQLKPSFTPVDV